MELTVADFAAAWRDLQAHRRAGGGREERDVLRDRFRALASCREPLPPGLRAEVVTVLATRMPRYVEHPDGRREPNPFFWPGEIHRVGQAAVAAAALAKRGGQEP